MGKENVRNKLCVVTTNRGTGENKAASSSRVLPRKSGRPAIRVLLIIALIGDTINAVAHLYSLSTGNDCLATFVKAQAVGLYNLSGFSDIMNAASRLQGTSIV